MEIGGCYLSEFVDEPDSEKSLAAVCTDWLYIEF
jgi:hypothetical protein